MDSKCKWIIEWGAVGILLGLPFVYLDIWFVAILGAIFLLRTIDQTENQKVLFFGVWLAFTIKYLFPMFWIWSTYPVVWIETALWLQLLILLFCWLMSALALGLGGVFFAFCYQQMKSFFKRHFFLLLVSVSFVWVMAEIFASYAFSVISIGPGSAVTSALSFGYSGYLIAQHELLIHIARIAGVYGLSFVFMVVAFALYWFLKRRPTDRVKYIGLGAVTAFVAVGFIRFLEYPTVQRESYSVAIIDTRFPREALRSDEGKTWINDALYEAAAQAMEYEVEYVLLPEGSDFFDQLIPVSRNKSIIQSRFAEVSAVIIDSGVFMQNGEQKVLQTFIYDGIDESVERVQKRYLAPQGEYFPWFSSVVFTLFGFGDEVDQVEKQIAFRVGPFTNQSELEVNTPAILFCFESVDPLGVRKIVAERKGEVPFVAHPVSHAWFHDSFILQEQLDTMLRVQALWNETYIVSAGQHVAGRVYAPNGATASPETVSETEYWSVRLTDIPRR